MKDMPEGDGQAAASVMFVEDDFNLRDALIPVLEYEGHHVVGAANGREALERLRSMPRPSLILLDLMMPEMDGAAFRAEQLRDPDLASIPVVVVSADPSAVEKAERMGAVGCLQKPVDIDALIEEVRRRAVPAPAVNPDDGRKSPPSETSCPAPPRR
jgi:CheY-like chemotaxis protein